VIIEPEYVTVAWKEVRDGCWARKQGNTACSGARCGILEVNMCERRGGIKEI
jgi:hypothetical protein